MSTATLEKQAASEKSLAGKYLTFALGGESYGIPVLQVREIIRHIAVTAVPQMPDYVKGVLNLRGKVIPIVDLRVKFQLGSADIAERTCIIVVQVVLASGNRSMMGLIVDGVEAVANVAAKDIEPTPDFGAQISTDYILGMAKLENRVAALLDIDKVVAAETIEMISKTASAN
jgi:purine-binding chemotaxis protein CheW